MCAAKLKRQCALQCSVVHSVSEAMSKVKLEPKLLQRPSLSQVGVQAQCSLHYSAQCAMSAVCSAPLTVPVAEADLSQSWPSTDCKVCYVYCRVV